MMNMHNNKKARIIMGVVIVILIVAMVAPMALSVMIESVLEHRQKRVDTALQQNADRGRRL